MSVAITPAGRANAIAWIRDRMENCKRIALTKTGADRDGWEEDAAYFLAVLILLGEAKPKDMGE